MNKKENKNKDAVLSLYLHFYATVLLKKLYKLQ